MTPTSTTNFLVTGATSGLGLDLVRKLLERRQDARVVLGTMIGLFDRRATWPSHSPYARQVSETSSSLANSSTRSTPTRPRGARSARPWIWAISRVSWYSQGRWVLTSTCALWEGEGETNRPEVVNYLGTPFRAPESETAVLDQIKCESSSHTVVGCVALLLIHLERCCPDGDSARALRRDYQSAISGGIWQPQFLLAPWRAAGAWSRPSSRGASAVATCSCAARSLGGWRRCQ